MEMSDMPEHVQRMLKNAHYVEIHPPGCGCPAEEKSPWIQVGTLKPEDITRTVSMRAKLAELVGESNVHMAKMEALRTQHNAVSAEYWEHVVKTYSLPRDGVYEVRPADHVILMRPKVKKP